MKILLKKNSLSKSLLFKEQNQLNNLHSIYKNMESLDVLSLKKNANNN